MNIAILPSAFHPHLGGVEELVRQLAHELVRRGHGVHIHTNRWPKTLPENELFETLPVHRHCFRVPEYTARQLVGTFLFSRSTLSHLCADLRANGTDVLHVQCVSSNAYYALAAKRRLGLPLVVTLQGELTMDASRLFERSHFARSLLRRVLRDADVITACSQKTRDDAEAFYGKSFGRRCRIVWNGARAGDFSGHVPFPHPRSYILAMGRLAPQKGFDLLIRAMARAADREHDLLIAGEGPERGALEELIGKLNLVSRVRLIGRADRKRVGELFAGASFFVLPSRADEGLPVVCAEALAAGKAIIATRAGGAPEAVIDAGILVPVDDVPALSAAIDHLCEDLVLRESLEIGAREASSRFSWKSIARQYCDVYVEACASRLCR